MKAKDVLKNISSLPPGATALAHLKSVVLGARYNFPTQDIKVIVEEEITAVSMLEKTLTVFTNETVFQVVSENTPTLTLFTEDTHEVHILPDEATVALFEEQTVNITNGDTSC